MFYYITADNSVNLSKIQFLRNVEQMVFDENNILKVDSRNFNYLLWIKSNAMTLKMKQLLLIDESIFKIKQKTHQGELKEIDHNDLINKIVNITNQSIILVGKNIKIKELNSQISVVSGIENDEGKQALLDEITDKLGKERMKYMPKHETVHKKEKKEPIAKQKRKYFCNGVITKILFYNLDNVAEELNPFALTCSKHLDAILPNKVEYYYNPDIKLDRKIYINDPTDNEGRKKIDHIKFLKLVDGINHDDKFNKPIAITDMVVEPIADVEFDFENYSHVFFSSKQLDAEKIKRVDKIFNYHKDVLNSKKINYVCNVMEEEIDQNNALSMTNSIKYIKLDDQHITLNELSEENKIYKSVITDVVITGLEFENHKQRVDNSLI